jgi:muramidase (phage lysozyme)
VVTTPNITAFLTMLAHSEGVDNVRELTGALIDPFRVCYAKKHIIQDLRWHPHEERPDGSREWGGERLKGDYCIALGLKPGCVSTAAGRYQITCPTWLGWKSVLQLNDFGPIAQDDVAIQIIKKQGALELVNAGRLEDAIDKCHPIWASLPGSTSKQPQTPLATLMRAYTAAGGEFA